ncbi:SAM-dependent methyltransferase [Streptomyces sp. NPDC055078]
MTVNEPILTDVGAMYDRFTDIFTEGLGGSIHLGYWRDGDDDSSVSVTSERMTGMVADRLAADPQSRLLDIGCGTGRPALQIARTTGAHVTGVTVSDYQLRLASAAADRAGRAERVVFQHADAMKLPYANGEFHGAWAIESLVHMADPRAALAEAARVVTPGGRLVIADFSMREPVADEAWQVVNQLAQMFHTRTFPTHSDHRDNLAATGWELEDLTDIGEQVRAGYRHLIALMRRLADEAEGEMAAPLSAGADVIEALGAVPDLGYVLITATRRRDMP